MSYCVLPRTDLPFDNGVMCNAPRLLVWKPHIINHTTAIFRQINKDVRYAHRDALEFPDGQIVLLTHLVEGQEATVLQLPADPATASKVQAQEPLVYIG